MKNSMKTVLFLVVFGLLVMNIKPVFAQCAQCAAAVATNAQSGDTTAKGLNHGIMFLLTAPYIAVAVIGLVWYKKYRRKNVNLEMHNEKLNLN